MTEPDATAIRVIIDTREDELWGLLEGWREGFEGWRVERAALDVGDVAFLNQAGEELVLLERKSAEDLGSSQRDGRYREQRARLLSKKGAGVAIGYVLEAPTPWSPTLSRSWCRGVFKETHLQMAIVRLQLRYGIPVLQAGGPKETVMWIRRIAAALIADPAVFRTGIADTADGAAAAYTAAIHVKKAANMSQDRILSSMLRVIPGVGAAAVDAIITHVGSAGFPGFYAMTETEIAEVRQGEKRRVGPALAAKIWSAFHTAAAVATRE
jgi:ERCC4-type nuclease